MPARVPMLSCALAIGSASALLVGHTAPPRHPIVVAMSTVEPTPPSGFEWADSAAPAEPPPPAAATAAAVEPPPSAADAVVGKVVPTDASASPLDKVQAAMRPDGDAKASAAKEKKKPARKPSPTGIFAPVVLGAKSVMGTKELNALRADIIAKHTKVISAFVDTSESPFGQLVLKRMFAAADKDGNGTLDREEIRDALQALGFSFVGDKQIDQIMSRADENSDEVIDFEEFVKETPKTLRTSLVKLAKQNGHDLGFLA